MAGGLDSYKKFKKMYQGTGVEPIYMEWHDRQVQKLKNLIEDKKFLEDIEMMKGTDWDDVPLDQKVMALMVQYKCQVAMYELLECYFATGTINPHYMRFPVAAISTKRKSAAPNLVLNDGHQFYEFLESEYKRNPDRFLFLMVDPECTKTDMDQWVARWWTKIVKPMQDELHLTNVKRVRTSPNISRDRNIQEQIRVKKRPAKDVVKEVKGKVTEEYARQIAYRKSPRRKKDK